MKTRVALALCIPLLSLAPGRASEARELYENVKSTIEQWVETENLISKELNEWKREQALLEDTRSLLRAEREDLRAALEELEEGATAADEKRAELLAEKEELEASRDVVRGQLGELEARLKGMLPYFPEAFSESVVSVVRRLPDPGEETEQSLSQRLRNVVALLSQATKFDNAIALEREVREMSDGSSKEVSTLYLGFGIAYFADPSGAYAGYGAPTESGWKWTETPASSQAILDAIAVYEKSKTASFVRLPVSIQ